MLTSMSAFIHLSCLLSTNFSLSRVGRMEAKGCAKPAVWKDARRHFYWAVRGRVAKSAALAQIAEATPDSNLEYRTRFLNNLAGIDAETDYRQMAETIEKLDLIQAISQLRADHILRQLIQLTKDDRKVAVDGFMRLADNFTDEERAALINVLKTGPRSPGEYFFYHGYHQILITSPAPPSYSNTQA